MKMTNGVKWFAPLMLVFATSVFAQPKMDVVMDGLNNPCGVTVQPETGHVFVSDSAGGRVLRIVDGKPQDVITGFPKDVYGKGPKYDIGPLGLVFVDKDTLVVGGGADTVLVPLSHHQPPFG